MKPIRVIPVRADRVKISGIGSDLLFCVRRVPEILARRDEPPVRARLFPDPMPGHAEDNEIWRDTVEPDLRHLFESAEKTMLGDLANLHGDSVVLPAAHLDAWRSAINQARLILGALHDVTESDMQREDLNPRDARDLVLIQIHLLGYLLHELTEV